MTNITRGWFGLFTEMQELLNKLIESVNIKYIYVRCSVSHLLVLILT